jgi:hypothetical protein
MVLFSEMRIWLFTNFSGSDFFGGDAQPIDMGFSQKEAIVFVNDSLVYITDEKLLTLGGNLYKMDLTGWINSVIENPAGPYHLPLFPNPARDQLNISGRENATPLQCSLYDLRGKLMLKINATTQIDISLLPAGMYIVKALQGEKEFVGRFVKE